MHISYRPAMLADIECCLSDMLSPGFACPAEVLMGMAKLWSDWLLKGVAIMAIVEMRDPTGRERPVAFGLSVFVSEEFVESLLSGAVAPPVAASLARLAKTGKTPILSSAEVRRGNSVSGQGLNLLSPLIGWLPEMDGNPRLLAMVKAKLLEALLTMHAGYKLRRVMQEICSESEMQRGVAIGGEMFTDYANYLGESPPAPETHPYLVGMSRETIQESSTLWPLFLYTPPVIYFSILEQEVLRLATMGLADRQIAATLVVAQSTVHKRWHAVLRRAAPYSAIWMPESERAAPDARGRGSEKRHHLLNYLKSHPEELRPAERPEGYGLMQSAL